MSHTVLEQYWCKSHFATAHNVSRKYLDKIISEGLLDTVEVDGLTYIDMTNERKIKKALNSRKTPGEWSRSRPYKETYVKCTEQDAQFEKDWRESMGM